MIDENVEYSHGFIKAVPEEYAGEYFNQGKVFFNKLSYYQEIEEEDDNIGDRMENLSFNFPKAKMYLTTNIDQPKERLLDIDNYEVCIPTDFIQGSKKNNTDVVHCLYMTKINIMEESPNRVTLPVNTQYLQNYNDSRFFLIFDHKEYVKRIIDKLEGLGLDEIKCKSVQYFSNEDELFHVNGNPFKKRERYSYQNEYRIYVKKEDISTLTLEIGSLQDIAIEIQK